MAILWRQTNVGRFLFASTALNSVDTGVRSACREACIDDTISALEHGYETEVKGQGQNFSGGQLQRVRNPAPTGGAAG